MQIENIVEKTVELFENEAETFDVIITFKEWIGGSYPEVEGINQVELALKNIESYYIKETEFFEVVTVNLVNEDPNHVVKQLTKSPTDSIKKAFPIDIIVPSVSDKIIDTTIEVAETKIAKEKSFTIVCELRSKYSDSLNQLAEMIHLKVCKKFNLKYVNKNPDWIILIEELGKNTAIAIQHPHNVLINK